MSEEENKIDWSNKEIKTLLFVVAFILVIVASFHLAELYIAFKNPCVACNLLTGYVCINETDLPLTWRLTKEFNQVHQETYSGWALPDFVLAEIKNGTG